MTLPDRRIAEWEGFMERIKITEQISYCPATEEPLSADVGFIRCGEEWWIYDVGSSTEDRKSVV